MTHLPLPGAAELCVLLLLLLVAVPGARPAARLPHGLVPCPLLLLRVPPELVL